MIKRILIALDPDQDTPIATKYAISLAKRFDASLTGLAVVDTSNIYPTAIVGEIDNTHHARNLWEELSEDSKQMAEKLLQSFEKTVKEEGVRYTTITKEGASYERIIEGMKYHDLLITGRDSHFFYNEPKKETKTLAKVVKYGVAPTLVILEDFKMVNKVLIAFDGSNPSARSLKSFVHLSPYGKDLEIELVFVNNTSKKKNGPTNSVLDYAESYLQEHGFKSIKKITLEGTNPGDEILDYHKKIKPGLIVLGAHSVSAMKRLVFGSTTHDLITKTNSPLFLSP